MVQWAQGVPGCCCETCYTDAFCANCMPKWWCVSLDFYESPGECEDCMGEFCGEFSANCGKIEGSMVCGDDTVDITITIKKNEYDECQVCLNSTCLGITDVTPGACQLISDGNELDGISWDFDDFSGCGTASYCTASGTLTLNKSLKCTPKDSNECVGCNCFSKAICVTLNKNDIYNNDNDCIQSEEAVFDCDTQEATVTLECYDGDVVLIIRVGPEDPYDYTSPCVAYLTAASLGITELKADIVCSDGGFSVSWPDVDYSDGTVTISAEELLCGCECGATVVACPEIQLPDVLYAHFDDTAAPNGVCGDGFVLPLYIQKDAQGNPIGEIWDSKGHYFELTDPQFGTCEACLGGSATQVRMSFGCPAFSPCASAANCLFYNDNDIDCTVTLGGVTAVSCVQDPFEFVFSTNGSFDSQCLCTPDPGFDGQFNITVRKVP